MSRWRIARSLSFALVTALVLSALLSLPALASQSDWTRVGSGGLIGQFNNPQQEAMSSAVFDDGTGSGPRLYIGTYCGSDSAIGAQVWRRNADNDWTAVGAGGLGNTGNAGIASLCVAYGDLYAGTSNRGGRPEVYRYNGEASWVKVSSDSDVGAANNDGIYAMTVEPVTGRLLVGTSATFRSGNTCQVWAYNGNWSCLAGPGGIIGGGFGDLNNTIILGMAALGGNVYAGTVNDNGCEVWSWNGTAWAAALNETTTPTSGFGAGGVQPVAESMGTHDFGSGERLFVGTECTDFNGCVVWDFDPVTSTWTNDTATIGKGFGNGDNWIAGTILSAGTSVYVGTRMSGGGCELWKYDGANWTAVVGGSSGIAGGFGDSNNVEASTSASIGTKLFVGTANLNGACQVWSGDVTGGPWSQISNGGFCENNDFQIMSMAEYGGDLYAGSCDNARGGTVYRYRSGGWSAVSVPGFGQAANTKITSLCVMGQYLYAGTGNDNYEGSEVWRYDGSAWTCLAGSDPTALIGPGFDNSNNMKIPSMAVFNESGTDRLYMGTFNDSAGAEIWVYNGTGFTQSASAGIDDSNNYSISSMATYQGALYAGIEGYSEGELYRKTAGGPWSQMVGTSSPVGPGFGNDNNYGFESMAQFGPDLYVGTGNGSDGCQVWKDHAGTWSQVNESGFGEAANEQGRSMAVFGGRLLVGTEQWSGPGCDVWAFDGSSWMRSNDPGFGNASNLEAVLCPSSGYLYAGTRNKDTGAEVWRMGPAPTIDAVSPGSGKPGSTVTITGHDFGAAQGSSFVSFDSTKADCVSWADAQVKVTVPQMEAGEKQVTATTGIGTSNVRSFTVESPSPPPPPPPPTSSAWYLAEGTNAWGFSTYITIENPNASSVQARLTYMDPNPPASGKGILKSRTITLPATSQTTVSSMGDIGPVDFSTKVEALDGKTIAVDRTMFWTGAGTTARGYHSSIGTQTPSRTWYLPEGSSNWGFETWTAVLNPNPSTAHVTLVYMTETGTRTVNKTIPPNSRATWSMASDIGGADASIEVTSDIPVVAERSMYNAGRREGSCSIGAPAPATDFYLSEGAVGYNAGFTTWVLVQNPGNTENQVSLAFQTGKGQVAGPTFTMRANSRKTIKLNDYLPADTAVSTKVHGSKPLVAERAMYWDVGTGQCFHASIGLSEPHMTFMCPDGQVGQALTYTLVQNPNPGAVTVRITYLPQDGGKATSFTAEIPRESRATFNMADRIKSGRAAILVESLDGARPIMVERSMYGADWGSGTDTVGAYGE